MLLLFHCCSSNCRCCRKHFDLLRKSESLLRDLKHLDDQRWLVLPACSLWFYNIAPFNVARIRWHDHIRNTEVTTLTSLSPVSESIIRRRNSLFGHVTRLAEDTPAHQALRCHVDMTLGRFPDRSWRRRPGRPRNRWLDQLRGDNNSSPADLWRRASSRGHSGVTLWSSPTTH